MGSLCTQIVTDFEVIIVEDGSSIPCEAVCQCYANRLNIRYFAKSNSGPGLSRNYGAERAQGTYLLILDSDVILPTDYLRNIQAELQQQPVDAFGGPDRAHESFTPVQKAINYAMTSFFTTGGIRGGKKKMLRLFDNAESRSELVATFLAVLELCKANRVHLDGEGDDMEITMVRRKVNDDK